jgi:transketolase
VRTAFVKTLVEMASRDPRILLLTADLGYSALEPFAEQFPDRFFNVGVAEQNMIGLATGLAEAGLIPFAYSIANFAALRPYEFIRNGPVLHKLPVRIVGVGGGFEYSHAGPTHFGLEDAGIMRIQNGLTVISPADHQQTRTALLRTTDVAGPIYFRIGKDDRTVIPGLDGRFELGRVQVVREEGEVVFVCMGSVTAEAAAAVERLRDRGIDAGLVVVAHLNPAPADDLASVLSRFPVAVSVEAHSIVGGVGSLVAEVIAERGLDCRLVRSGVRSVSDGISGSQGFMHSVHGLSADALCATATDALEGVRRGARYQAN